VRAVEEPALGVAEVADAQAGLHGPVLRVGNAGHDAPGFDPSGRRFG
jgi:hypothetical protein